MRPLRHEPQRPCAGDPPCWVLPVRAPAPPAWRTATEYAQGGSLRRRLLRQALVGPQRLWLRVAPRVGESLAAARSRVLSSGHGTGRLPSGDPRGSPICGTLGPVGSPSQGLPQAPLLVWGWSWVTGLCDSTEVLPGPGDAPRHLRAGGDAPPAAAVPGRPDCRQPAQRGHRQPGGFRVGPRGALARTSLPARFLGGGSQALTLGTSRL